MPAPFDGVPGTYSPAEGCRGAVSREDGTPTALGDAVPRGTRRLRGLPLVRGRGWKILVVLVPTVRRCEEYLMKVKLYALSTCPYCKMTKKYLDENSVEYDATDVDLLDGEPRQEAIDEVKRISGGTSFPVVQVGDEVVVGFNKAKLKELLGLAA
jgi:glutaredoxin